MREADYFWDWFFSLWEGAETSWIEVRVDLLDELEGHEIEDEGLLVEHDEHGGAELARAGEMSFLGRRSKPKCENQLGPYIADATLISKKNKY